MMNGEKEENWPIQLRDALNQSIGALSKHWHFPDGNFIFNVGFIINFNGNYLVCNKSHR